MPSVRGKNHLQALKCEPVGSQGGQEAGAEQSSEGSNWDENGELSRKIIYIVL